MNILTYGTFDLLHKGHINLLKRAKKLGDKLIVGLSTDEFNRIKKKECVMPYEERKLILESLEFVDFVFPEICWEQKIDDIDKYNIDTFVMGDDWKSTFDYLSNKCKVIYLPRTPDISTSELKKKKKIKVLYYTTTHFPHMYPYYKHFGGLVFEPNLRRVEQLKKQYEDINVARNPRDILDYDPDIVLYTDYHPFVPVKNAKHIMLFHGLCKKGYFAIKKSWNCCEKYDLCLLYGNQLLKEFADNNWNIKYKIIGYPRFDKMLSFNEKLFENDRKTILVTPTWGQLSLIKKFSKALIELSKTYNVIIKVHPITANFETRDDSIKYLKELIKYKSNTLKLFSNLDALLFMPQADILISAYSSTMEEFLYFNKPIIVADPGLKPCENLNPQKVWDVCTMCKNPDDLKKIVKSVLKKDTLYSKRKQYFDNLIYNEKETTATERGIKAIEEVIKK